jgi:hypothetical protein
MQKLEECRTMQMEKMTGIDEKTLDRVSQMMEIQKEALELFRRKNADYGDAFANYGTTGVIMRMGDKMQRFVSITKTGVNLVDTESLRDTLIDLHNYSAMAIMLLDEEKEIN